MRLETAPSATYSQPLLAFEKHLIHLRANWVPWHMRLELPSRRQICGMLAATQTTHLANDSCFLVSLWSACLNTTHIEAYDLPVDPHQAAQGRKKTSESA